MHLIPHHGPLIDPERLVVGGVCRDFRGGARWDASGPRTAGGPAGAAGARGLARPGRVPPVGVHRSQNPRRPVPSARVLLRRPALVPLAALVAVLAAGCGSEKHDAPATDPAAVVPARAPAYVEFETGSQVRPERLVGGKGALDAWIGDRVAAFALG